MTAKPRHRIKAISRYVSAEAETPESPADDISIPAFLKRGKDNVAPFGREA